MKRSEKIGVQESCFNERYWCLFLSFLRSIIFGEDDRHRRVKRTLFQILQLRHEKYFLTVPINRYRPSYTFTVGFTM